MSRAFVKESDREEELPPVDPVLPPGADNRITVDGAARLRAEMDGLRDERAGLKGATSAEELLRLRAIDRRLAWFARRSPTWVETTTPPGAVRFGARVTYEDEGGKRMTVRIVGVDEVDAPGTVSWLSPIARALLGAGVGDVVRLVRPGGDEDVELIAIG